MVNANTRTHAHTHKRTWKRKQQKATFPVPSVCACVCVCAAQKRFMLQRNLLPRAISLRAGRAGGVREWPPQKNRGIGGIVPGAKVFAIGIAHSMSSVRFTFTCSTTAIYSLFLRCLSGGEKLSFTCNRQRHHHQPQNTGLTPLCAFTYMEVGVCVSVWKCCLEHFPIGNTVEP